MKHPRLGREKFGTLATGEVVEAITMVNAHGMSVRIITYGASIQSVCVADRNGAFADVTTGYATLADYVAQPQYFGSTVGRGRQPSVQGAFQTERAGIQASRK